MARGSSLLNVLNQFRAEARMSLNPAHNSQARDAQVLWLQTKQTWLWEDFAWPHLRVERAIKLQAGQRYYAPPDDVKIDRIEAVFVRYGGEWLPLKPDIGMEHYAAVDSDLDVRSWPAERWQIYEDQQIEIWPVPADNADDATLEGQLKVVGIRDLKPFVADGDRADLDDRLLVLYAAGEYLASTGAKDAQLKLQQARARYDTLKSNATPRKRFRLYGESEAGRELRGPPRVHYRIVQQ